MSRNWGRRYALSRHRQARVQGCVKAAVAHDSGEQAPVLYQDFVEDADNARGCEQKAARRLSSAAAPVKGTLGRSILHAARRRQRSTLSYVQPQHASIVH